MKKFLDSGIILIIVFIFFWQVFLKGLLPIPSDTIVGLYYPFRDIYSATNPSGIPFKNFLITDPVRQQYPWRNLSIDLEKKLQLPLWNPYNLAGTPLMANFQSAVFYPLSITFFILSFEKAWTLLIILQPLLAGFFMLFYLKNLRLNQVASLLGAISFSFSGFFISWLAWNTVIHTFLWLPLILLSIDKLVDFKKNKSSIFLWMSVFTFSLISSFFAGHLQVFFYLLIVTISYIFARYLQKKLERKVFGLFLSSFIVFFIITSIQWIPSLNLILLSARDIDIQGLSAQGWLIPWQNMVQFVAPDFFGNPTTLNYWGIWNYGEFVGYVGILPLIMAFLALFFRKDKKTFFFGTCLFMAVIFSFQSFISEIPFRMNLPFLSTSQPTRLISLVSFSLSILGALGFDYFLKNKNKKELVTVLAIFILIFGLLWSFVKFLGLNFTSVENLKVSQQNLIFPSLLFLVISLALLSCIYFTQKNKLKDKLLFFSISFILLITIFDLLRFGWKFIPFTKPEYLFPKTKITSFLDNQEGIFRVMSADPRILPPNFSIIYKLQTIDGYDPLYLRRYGELIAASERGKPDINPPFGFNRIVNPKNYSSRIIDLLNVKYILSIDSITDPKLKEVFRDGNVIVYENNSALPRAFFAENLIYTQSKQETINRILDPEISLYETAIVENEIDDLSGRDWSLGEASIVSYSENKIVIKTNNSGLGFLVLTDAYYPNWHAKIDGQETMIYLTNFNFRGIVVPGGEHEIEFYITLF